MRRLVAAALATTSHDAATALAATALAAAAVAAAADVHVWTGHGRKPHERCMRDELRC